MNKTLKQIFRAFEMNNRCWAGDDGVSGNSDDDKVVDDNKADDTKADDTVVDDKMVDDDVKDDFDKYGIPEGVRDDEAVIESVKERIKADEEDDKDTDDDTKDDDTKDKDDDDTKDKDDDDTKDTKDVKDDKEEEYDLKFEEDVTIGDMEFKKEDLATTPKKILENISSIHAQLEAANEELESAKTANESVMDDPVVKERIARINEGKGDEPYDFYVVSKDTEKFIEETFGLDLEDKEDKEKLEGLYKEIEADLQDNIEKIVNNSLARNNKVEQSKALSKKGMNNILAIQDKYIDKKYHIKEKNLEKLWEQKDKHPEWEKFNHDKGLGRIQKVLAKTFKTYSQVSEMETETLYAIAATKLKLPFTANTKERDKKIIKDHEKKLLDIFKPKKVAKALGSSGDASAKKKHSILGDSVIDDQKLMDHEYIQSLMDRCKTDDEVMELREEIDAKIAKLQPKK
jgi:hypothetical protein